MRRFIIAAPFIDHGWAHISGFLVSWTKVDAGYKDRSWIFSSEVTMKSGIGRLFGLLWLVALVGFVAAGVGLLVLQSW